MSESAKKESCDAKAGSWSQLHSGPEHVVFAEHLCGDHSVDPVRNDPRFVQASTSATSPTTC